MFTLIVGNHVIQSLTSQAFSRLQQAFRPKTKAACSAMFHLVIAFCVIMDLSIKNVSLQMLLSFLECLAHNACSVSLTANYVSALKDNFILYNLPFILCDHPKIKYFHKAMKINMPLSVTQHNIIGIHMPERISLACQDLYMGKVFRAMFLVGFFGFMRLSNLALHSLTTFDPTHHLTGADVFHTRNFAKLLLKWTKTYQDRSIVQFITLPKLDSNICPV